MKVYTFHSVANNGLSLPVSMFRRFMGHLTKRHAFVDPEVFDHAPAQNGVLLTFDDCFADNFSNALPVLQELGVKAMFFFTPGYLGRVRWGSPAKGNWSDNRSSDYSVPFGFMGVDELLALRSMGHEIGFHSRTHPNLPECSAAQMHDEIDVAKKEWEKTLGFSFRCFAYPRGRYTEAMLPIVADAGYTYAFSTERGEITAQTLKKKPFLLPRLPVQRRGLFGWL